MSNIVPIASSNTFNGYVCLICGEWVPWGAITHTCNIYVTNNPAPPMQGWECPRCHRIHAPWVASCDCPPAVSGMNSDKVVIVPKETTPCD